MYSCKEVANIEIGKFSFSQSVDCSFSYTAGKVQIEFNTPFLPYGFNEQLVLGKFFDQPIVINEIVRDINGTDKDLITTGFTVDKIELSYKTLSQGDPAFFTIKVFGRIRCAE